MPQPQTIIDKFPLDHSRPYVRNYEVFIEGDVNDGDYLQWTTVLPLPKLEGSNFLLYLISFLHTHGKHFASHPDWVWFADAGVDDPCGAFDDIKLPSVEGRFVHSITKMEIVGVRGGIYAYLQIPEWDSLFSDPADKKNKLSAAFDDWRRNASEAWRLAHEKEA